MTIRYYHATRRFVIWILAVLLYAGCKEQSSEENQEPASPNIVFILADDLGYGDLAVYNPGSKISTPNLDRLAAQGMRFTDAHSPSSVCTPTRYGILTGRYCWRSRLPQGVLRGYGRALIEPGRLTVASLLQQHGYRTGVVGKWHLGLDWVVKEGHEQALSSEADTRINDLGMVTEMNPNHIDFTKKPTDGPLDHGFDYSFILPASLDMDPYCYLENDGLVTLPIDSTEGNDLNTGYTGAFWRAGRMAPDFEFEKVLPTFVDKAIQFIKLSTTERTSKPFFLYLPLAAPHTPWAPTGPHLGTSGAGSYGDFVSMVDAEMGRVFSTLRELGIEENTIVFFTSDNGPFWTPALIEQYGHRAAGNKRGMKADSWEGGHRIPFIVRWPGNIVPGAVNHATISLTNLMATAADLVGSELPFDAGEDSHSILPLLMGADPALYPDPALIQHSSKGFFVVREGPWKLILGRGSGGFSAPVTYSPRGGEAPGQLYHLDDDPKETQNLYQQQPDKVKELHGILEKFKSEGRSR